MTWIGIYLILPVYALTNIFRTLEIGLLISIQWIVVTSLPFISFLFFFYICFLKTVWEIVFQLFCPLYIAHDNELNSFLVFYALFFNKSLEDLYIIERRWEHCEHLGEMEIKQNLQRLYLFEDSPRIFS